MSAKHSFSLSQHPAMLGLAVRFLAEVGVSVKCFGLVYACVTFKSRLNLGRKRTTEVNKRLGSDHRQCQLRKVALRKCSEKDRLVQ